MIIKANGTNPCCLFSHRFHPDNQVFLYLGMPGEPALGPTAYMHRPANQTNPSAILSHYNQDATHITFGVATLGWMNRMFKIDGSVFTGREPDEDRYDFDRPKFDSYSLRVEFVPNKFITSQVSAGFIKSPEVLEPDEDLMRVTASLLHVRPFGEGNFISSGLIYGGNSHLDGELRNSMTLELEWDWNLGTFLESKSGHHDDGDRHQPERRPQGPWHGRTCRPLAGPNPEAVLDETAFLVEHSCYGADGHNLACGNFSFRAFGVLHCRGEQGA
jgi:hypothetical protein